jgi:peptidoglycan/LPS O-acetylase OafA/YrhL
MIFKEVSKHNNVVGKELEVFHTLNAMRGIAAIIVVMGHAPKYFGTELPSTYLAVDLFFVLSGFVLAHVYEKRFSRGLRTAQFMTLRYIRLIPFFGLGIAISITGVFIASLFGAPIRWTVVPIAICAFFNLLFLPAPPIHGALLFPLDDPGWSLFFELFANLLYVLTWRVLSNRVLTCVICVAGVSLLIYSNQLGGLSGGWNWATFGVGIARVLFSFPAGILIYRLTQQATPIRLNPAPIFAVTIAVLVINPGEFGSIYAVVAVVAVLPALVLIGSMTRPTRLIGLYSFMGVTSYGIYAIHKPIINISDGFIVKLIKTSPDAKAPWIGIAFILSLLGAVWLLDKYFDIPFRRALSTKQRREIRNSISR